MIAVPRYANVLHVPGDESPRPRSSCLLLRVHYSVKSQRPEKCLEVAGRSLNHSSILSPVKYNLSRHRQIRRYRWEARDFSYIVPPRTCQSAISGSSAASANRQPSVSKPVVYRNTGPSRRAKASETCCLGTL